MWWCWLRLFEFVLCVVVLVCFLVVCVCVVLLWVSCVFGGC